MKRIQKYLHLKGETPSRAPRFAREYGPWGNPAGAVGVVAQLLDHGWIFDRACEWLGNGAPEIAVVARTYCDVQHLVEPPAGLKVTRLPKAWLEGSPGTLIAVHVRGRGEGTDAFLHGLTDLPANLLLYALPNEMHGEGYCVELSVSRGSDFPEARCVRTLP